MLHGSNAQIAQAYDAQSALEVLHSESRFGGFRVVLYSMEAAALDWEEFAARVRSNSKLADVRLILLTRSAHTPGPTELVRTGYVSAVRRNASRQQLWTPLEVALVNADESGRISTTSQTRDLRALAQQLEVAKEEQPVAFDRQNVLERFGDDWELLYEMVQVFRDSSSMLTVDFIRAMVVRDSLAASDALEKLRHAAQFFGASLLCERLSDVAELLGLSDWGALPRSFASARVELNRLCAELPYFNSVPTEDRLSC